MVTLVDASGTAVADTDGNPADGHFLGTIAADGSYYAKVAVPVWSYNGHDLSADQRPETWTQAEAEAEALGGHLATVNDAAEQTWLTSTFGNFANLGSGAPTRRWRAPGSGPTAQPWATATGPRGNRVQTRIGGPPPIGPTWTAVDSGTLIRIAGRTTGGSSNCPMPAAAARVRAPRPSTC